MKNQEFKHRLGFALSGLVEAIKRENSLKTQLVFAFVAMLALIILRPDWVWWALVVVMIALVMAAELFNTALEGLCDYIQPEQHHAIGYIKDVAAGAVWLLSVAAALVGFFMVLSAF